MAEYIDRAEYCEKYCRCSNEYCDRQSCPIWKAPAADVAPVVRCKDCRYWGDEAGIAVRTDGVRFARCKVHNLCVSGKRIGWCPTEDDFCSQGEMRDENENR